RADRTDERGEGAADSDDSCRSGAAYTGGRVGEQGIKCVVATVGGAVRSCDAAGGDSSPGAAGANSAACDCGAMQQIDEEICCDRVGTCNGSDVREPDAWTRCAVRRAE